MIDISEQLGIISVEPQGEQVRSAVADAMEIIETYEGSDISEYLTKIRTSRYGYEIRGAIHDALLRLSMVTPTPTVGGSCAGPTSFIIFIQGAMSTVGGATTIIEEGS